MKIQWLKSKPLESRCLACNATGLNDSFVSVSAGPTILPVEFFKCRQCASLFVPDFQTPPYEINVQALSGGELEVKFYLELGAGLETLALPAASAQNREVSHYLEVGSGFGFGLDFARTAFNWGTKGIDPGGLAKIGRRLLGVDIDDRYLGPDERMPVAYDVVGAIEVIEHLAQPAAFLATLKNAMSGNGLLFLTTPDADTVKYGVEGPGLLAALSPGYHAVLFSQQAMRNLLKTSGFDEFRVERMGAGLLAVAGTGAAKIDTNAIHTTPAYLDYLEKRTGDDQLDLTLQIGLNYRLFKLLVNKNKLVEAEARFTKLAALILKRDGLQIDKPLEVLARVTATENPEQLMRNFPTCLSCIFYFAGIRYLNWDGNGMRAMICFFASFLIGKFMIRALLTLGLDDGEFNDLQTQALKHLSMVTNAASIWPIRLNDL